MMGLGESYTSPSFLHELLPDFSTDRVFGGSAGGVLEYMLLFYAIRWCLLAWNTTHPRHVKCLHVFFG